MYEYQARLVRPVDGEPPAERYKDADWCRARYFNANKTLREIAEEAGCSLRTVARWFDRHGIKLPSHAEKRTQRGNNPRGEKSPRWRGGPQPCPACGSPRSYHTGTSVKRCMNCRNNSFQGTGNPKWRGGEIGYGAAHDRVRALHGSASGHACRHCAGQAAHWAYDHTDPDEKHDPEEGVYSPDPIRYMPLCASCHKRFDNAHRRALASQTDEEID